MLFDALAIVARTHPQVAVPHRRRARRAGRGGAGAGRTGRRRAIFTGYQPAREMPAFVAASDILASPRIAGTNTPLKIYSYLRSGKPIVATDLLTHTQVLDRETRCWSRRSRTRLPRRSTRLLDEPVARRASSRAPPRERARTRYSRDAYVARTREVCERVARPRSGVVGAVARMKVLVTGATGFTGGHLARHLLGAAMPSRRSCGRRAFDAPAELAAAGVEIRVG